MQSLLIKRVCVSIASVYLLGLGAIAYAQEYKFAYSTPYKPAVFSKKPKAEDLQAAIDKAAS